MQPQVSFSECRAMPGVKASILKVIDMLREGIRRISSYKQGDSGFHFVSGDRARLRDVATDIRASVVGLRLSCPYGKRETGGLDK